MSSSSSSTLPSTRAPGITSCIRLRVRRNGRLAAAGRADERGDAARLDRERHVLDGLEPAVVDVTPDDVDALGHGVCSYPRLGRTGRRVGPATRSRATRLSSMTRRSGSAPRPRHGRRRCCRRSDCVEDERRQRSRPARPANGLMLIDVVDPTVSSSGAVSPMTRATASMTPVMMPGSAVGSTTRRSSRHSARRARTTPRAARSGPA